MLKKLQKSKLYNSNQNRHFQQNQENLRITCFKPLKFYKDVEKKNTGNILYNIQQKDFEVISNEDFEFEKDQNEQIDLDNNQHPVVINGKKFDSLPPVPERILERTNEGRLEAQRKTINFGRKKCISGTKKPTISLARKKRILTIAIAALSILALIATHKKFGTLNPMNIYKQVFPRNTPQ